VTSLASRLLGIYLWIVGALLLLQGTGSLILRSLGDDDPSLTHGFVNADPLHATIHVLWGLAMLVPLSRGVSVDRLVVIALVFGVFYVALAFLGVLVYHPFGLQLGPFENGFHFIVGPTSLVLGIGALVSRRGSLSKAT